MRGRENLATRFIITFGNRTRGSGSMKVGPWLLAVSFGAYFVLVAVAASVTANATTAVWYGPEASFWSYAMFLLTFLIVLGLAPILGSVRRAGNPGLPSGRALAGPAVVAAVFVAISAAMLPGAGGFLQTNYKLNTTLILTMAYSWLGLAFYWAASSAVAMRSH